MKALTLAVAVSDKQLSGEVQKTLSSGTPVEVLVTGQQKSGWDGFVNDADRSKPDAVIIDVASFDRPLEAVIQQLRRTAGTPAVIVLHTEPSTETILRAMRAGAAEYLFPPIESGLRAALERISAERGSGSHSAQGSTLAVFGAKGGCGATTVACHVALELQRCTKAQVLLADFDLETGLIGFLLKSKSPYSVADAIYNIERLDLSYWKALVSNGIPGLEVIKAPAATLGGHAPVDEQLRRLLRFARPYYAWSVADLGRSQNLGALEEADKALLVTTIDVPALHQAKHLVRTLKDAGYGADRLHVVLNRVPSRTEVTQDEVRDLLGVEISAILPEDAEALYDAYADGKLLPPNSSMMKRIASLAAKLAGVVEQKPRRRFLF